MPATFFVKKSEIFENVKSKRAVDNFQKSPTLCASTVFAWSFFSDYN